MPTGEQMADIEAHFRPKRREWFQPAIDYEGRGRAEFVSNPGAIEGPVSIFFREDGVADRFDMEVDSLIVGEQAQGTGGDGVFAFVNTLPIPGAPGAYGFGGFSNECSGVDVEAEGWSISADSPHVSASGGRATFRATRTVARRMGAVEPIYWVAPLLNFLSHFVQAGTELQGHPLRVRETAPYEPVGNDTDRFRAMAYRKSNALIAFHCEGHLGFVEPLWDYASRRDRVLAGDTLATAIMVGRLPLDFSAEDGTDWFPSDLLTLLGLAGGREIGVPFVELRGEAGQIVSRMHLRAGDPATHQRRPLIDESIDRSTGALLTAFLGSAHRNDLWLRVALRHLQRALAGEMTLEDRLGHLFRVVEGLAGGLELNRSRPLELSAETRERVVATIDACVDQLVTIADNAPSDDKARLESIKSRVKAVQSNSPSFQTQLLDLVGYASLPDASWLREFSFRAKLKGEPTSWSAVASQLRNRIFHRGFVNFEQFDVENIVPFIDHLADVLSRVVFGLIGFESSYRPPCGDSGMVTHVTPDWADPERLTAERLRYVP